MSIEAPGKSDKVTNVEKGKVPEKCLNDDDFFAVESEEREPVASNLDSIPDQLIDAGQTDVVSGHEDVARSVSSEIFTVDSSAPAKQLKQKPLKRLFSKVKSWFSFSKKKSQNERQTISPETRLKQIRQKLNQDPSSLTRAEMDSLSDEDFAKFARAKAKSMTPVEKKALELQNKLAFKRMYSKGNTVSSEDLDLPKPEMSVTLWKLDNEPETLTEYEINSLSDDEFAKFARWRAKNMTPVERKAMELRSKTALKREAKKR